MEKNIEYDMETLIIISFLVYIAPINLGCAMLPMPQEPEENPKPGLGRTSNSTE